MDRSQLTQSKNQTSPTVVWFGLNIFICHKQDKRIRHKLYNLGCRPRYVHDIHTLTYNTFNMITIGDRDKPDMYERGY